MLTSLRALVIVAGALFSFVAIATTERLDMLDVVAKLSADGGHGSGAHIGNGRFLTAAHVAEEDRALTVRKRNGETGTSTLVWRDAGFDIAVIQTTLKDGPVADISCRDVAIGEQISHAGNPRYHDFVQTWGRVAGAIINDADGTWKKVVPIDITSGPGFSGGPVFDKDHKIVGVLVAGYSLSVPVYRGFAFMVPSSAVCVLMAKHAS